MNFVEQLFTILSIDNNLYSFMLQMPTYFGDCVNVLKLNGQRFRVLRLQILFVFGTYIYIYDLIVKQFLNNKKSNIYYQILSFTVP